MENIEKLIEIIKEQNALIKQQYDDSKKLELKRINNSKEKWNLIIKVLTKNGVLEKLAQKFIELNSFKIETSALSFKENITEKEMMEELEKGLRERPLLTHIELLRESIELNGPSVLNSEFRDLLKSSTEEEARKHLEKVKENPNNLFKLGNSLHNASQKKVLLFLLGLQ